MIRDRISRGEIQANTSSTNPAHTATPTNPSPGPSLSNPAAPPTQIQVSGASIAPETPSVLTGAVPSVVPPTARSASMAIVTPSRGSHGSTTATQMDSGPNTLLHQLMSNASARFPASTTSSFANDTVTTTFNGGNYQIRHMNYSYRLTQQALHLEYQGALVDSGANGGMAGSDTRVLATIPHSFVDITGVGGEVLQRLPIVQSASLVHTIDEGPIILIMSQYAHKPDSKSIHSKSQIEHFGGVVHDSARATGGQQLVVTHEGYTIPLHVRNGLYYMDMVPPTDDDMEQYPHVFITADSPWNPDSLDEEFLIDASDSIVDIPGVQARRDSRAEVELFMASTTTASPSLDTPITQARLASTLHSLFIMPQKFRRRLPDLDALLPNFGWVGKERIRDTLEKTTQHYKADQRVPMRKHFRSRFPAANVRRLPEWYSTDTFISDVPAHDDGTPGHGGCRLVQIYGGLDSELLAGYPMSSESDVSTTLQDFIRDYGAMEGLKSDNAKAETSFKMKDLFRMYLIKDKQSEPHYQHQNPIERRIQDLKRMMHGIMDRVGCPPPFWLLCLLYVIHLLNVLSNSKGCIPLTVVTGTQTDISPYLDFHFWQEVFVEVPGGGEQLAHWCGPSHKQGDFLTYFVLLEDTQQLVTRSNVRYAKDPLFPNRCQRPAPSDGDTNAPVSKPIVTTIQDYYSEPVQLPVFSPDELLGMTILRPVDDELVRAKVVRKIMDRDAENHQQIKFLLALGDGKLEEIISYNELNDLVTESLASKESGQQDLISYAGILDHQGPLKKHDPKYKGSSYNVLVDWDDKTQTWEPLNTMAKQDPVTLARYAYDNGLLNEPGWKFLRRTAKRQRFLNVIINAVKRRKDPNQVKYKFGVRVPRTFSEAMALDKENGTTVWADAVHRELDQLFSYKSFRDIGPGGFPGPEFKKIKIRFVFDVKADGRQNGRLVARGDMTPEPEEAVYSSVATL